MSSATGFESARSPAPRRVPRVPRVRREASASPHSTCTMRQFCEPPELSPADLARVDSVVFATRSVHRGETLYCAGDDFHSIYTVRAGCFKTVITHRDGREQVTGFHLPGETLGLDGICTDRHGCEAVALEDSIVCIVPYALLELLCREVKAMQHHVHRLLSAEIVRESGLMLMLGTMSAEQRVAAFLLNLSTRFEARGYSAAEFNLRMTREEMGSYLGLKLETVSRMLSKFQKEGLIDTHGRQVRIADREALARV
ncbi:transcriptional regulator, Crp/Fnr family [Caballeronia glathei]|jgi:CRP/FNR family transcriptional regulator|uniref:Crp/Fnr family transcriptional regulator n=1 Tax=Caballeronia glathei TaxID=60547 RepID=A0A069PRC2_9BURK|nr:MULTISPECIES: helix-turn-helix domain-containing protein [Burkholderiaceae]KDR42997.1 Crp/Fnr family transcriptional regulator [Caballeronia glathei]TCK39239.1 Crp/Fnr family transcriptional regulator [Paraburkholderia sp. BL8N3]CDY75341.1 transcriptional regulator, Crp/Fnr family [Caballeronia glathei]